MAAGASELMRTVDDNAIIKICSRNEEDGQIIEKQVQLLRGCVSHATLQSQFPTAESLNYRDSDGVTRKLKKDGADWRPPKGGVWRDDVEYVVQFPDPNAPPPAEKDKNKSCEII